jgi:DNA repair protein RadA/Sms
MAKAHTKYSCTSCGASFATWAGRCPVCGEWNTLIEEPADEVISTGRGATSGEAEAVEVLSVSELPNVHPKRIITGMDEFDRVLGSDDPGIVAGSIILLAGSPGVGKSTLLLQVASSLKKALYFSAEESLEQIRSRSYRLGIEKSSLLLASERNLNKIIATIRKEKPTFVVIDSIQTVYDDTISGTPGAVMQVRDNCWRLQQLSKITGTAILLVGHITKEGAIAGPKVLEHLVDVVLYLEGEKRTGLRILRAEKNRFGSTEEIGIWQLTSAGYKTVEDPGKLFASLVTEDAPGRSLSITIEGTRPFLLEIQALVAKTSFGYPKRTAQGFDVNRLSILLAVIENQLGLPLSGYDVFINVVGGFTVRDPGVDLAVAGAVISSLKKKPLQSKLALVGEIGLLGEIRPAFDHTKRVKEAKKLGYETNRGLRSVKDILQTIATKPSA